MVSNDESTTIAHSNSEYSIASDRTYICEVLSKIKSIGKYITGTSNLNNKKSVEFFDKINAKKSNNVNINANSM